LFFHTTVENSVFPVAGCSCYQEDTGDFGCERNPQKEAGGKKKSM
jgi:hypothetical protein